MRTTARTPTAWAKRWTVLMDGVPHACSHFALGHAHVHVADVIAELRNGDCRNLKQLYKITVFLGAT
jgi:hypothetical protein